jgi:hypothetical protein
VWSYGNVYTRWWQAETGKQQVSIQFATSEYESSQTKSFNVDGGHSLIPGKEA